MANPCLVKQLNPHAVPYLKVQENPPPPLCFPFPEPYLFPPPQSYIFASYQTCMSFPVCAPPAGTVYYYAPSKTASFSEVSKPKAKKLGKARSSVFSRGSRKLKELNDEGEVLETSLMIKNIPNQLRKADIIAILDKHCLDENMKSGSCSEYDFFYLPMDFERHANLGYAFVNFTNEAAAQRFWAAFDGYKWQVSENKKICEVNKALLQGKEAFIRHFKNSVFPCNSNSYLPVTFAPPRDGFTQCSRSTIVGKRVARAASQCSG